MVSRELIVIFFLSLILGCATASNKGVITEVEIVEFGIYKKAKEGIYVYVRETEHIPSIRGTRFGAAYRIYGEPLGATAYVYEYWVVAPRTEYRPYSIPWGGKRKVELGADRYTYFGVFGGIEGLPGRVTLVVKKKDGTVFLEKDFWIVEVDDE